MIFFESSVHAKSPSRAVIPIAMILGSIYGRKKWLKKPQGFLDRGSYTKLPAKDKSRKKITDCLIEWTEGHTGQRSKV